MTDSPKPRAVPRCLLIRGSHAVWRFKAGLYITAIFWSVTLMAALAACTEHTACLFSTGWPIAR